MGADVDAGDVQVRRTARSGGPRAPHRARRQASRRPRADVRGPARPLLRQAPPDRMARRAPARTFRLPSSTPSTPPSSPCSSCWTSPRDGTAAPRRAPHLPQSPQAPQLPPLLHRPGRLRQRHLDAEHRDVLVRAHADARPDRRRDPLLLPLRPVHGVRPVRRRGRRSLRQPQDGDRHAVDPDGAQRRPRGRRAARRRDRVARVRDRPAHRNCARVRCAGAPVAHVPDGRTRRAAERRGAQLEPLQHRADRRTCSRRCRDRGRRRRLVLRRECRELPRRSREPPADAPVRAVPAHGTATADAAVAERERGSPTHVIRAACS